MSDAHNVHKHVNIVNTLKQRFTGYWIPVELTQLGLTKQEQFLLSIIDSLDSGEPDFCFASNAYLAEQMQISESRVSFYLTRLKRMNLIEEISFTGRVRRIKVLKENWYKPHSKKESCVKTRRQTTRKHVGRLRENTQSIYSTANNTKESVVCVPPLVGGDTAQLSRENLGKETDSLDKKEFIAIVGNDSEKWKPDELEEA